ncbi:hypothetical protein, partial [Salinivibrio socompensis]|uniref:hypothetical protein n=1 Tax=Salinivibrio socompensis TaxID=1510206 RepID=UPI003B82F593
VPSGPSFLMGASSGGCFLAFQRSSKWSVMYHTMHGGDLTGADTPGSSVVQMGVKRNAVNSGLIGVEWRTTG